MTKVVTATVRFLVDEESATKLQAVLSNSPSWINESWFEKHYSEMWEDVCTMEIEDVSVENMN